MVCKLFFHSVLTLILHQNLIHANNIPMNSKFPYKLGNGKLAPPHRGKYIEVFSRPIKTTYSQVFWAQQDPVPLPAEFVEKYKGKTVGFVGYEVDVVRINETSGKYASVPCFEQYNHHFAVSLLGNESKLAYVGRQTYLDERDIMAHRHAPKYQAQTLPGADPDSIVPVMQMMVEGNGNEHRRTFKWFPTGYAQFLESPTSFSPNLMMINTNNPNTPNWGKRGGPLPKGGNMSGWISMGSRAPPNAEYSGLLECPCTTRVVKIFTGHTPLTKGTCSPSLMISTAKECYTASAMVYGGGGSRTGHDFIIISNKTIDSSTNPVGCYVLGSPKGFEVFFNTYNQTSNVSCGLSNKKKVRSTGYESIVLGSKFFGPGSSVVNISLDLDADIGNATITLSGPSSVWFAVGFNASAMKDTPYSIEVSPSTNGTKANVVERRLGNHASGTQLNSQSLHIISDTIDGSTRSVVLTRPLVGDSKLHYTFDPTLSSINIIAAIGSSETFGYHGNKRGGSSLMLVEMGAPICLCESKQQGGSINGLPWTSDCYNPNLIEQQNPSCDISTYRGGMSCCHNNVYLLDQDQELPTRVDTFWLKFRFYYEELPIDTTKSITKNVFFMFREVEYNHGEYDVPQCNTKTTAPSDCVHTLTSNFQVIDTISDCKGDRSKWMCAPSKPSFPQSQEIDLIHVSAHCHAPSCISMELINADTGESICLVEPIYGNGGDEIMNENGYVVGLPPCIWSTDPTEQKLYGLKAPMRLSLDTNLTAIKKSNSTNFHYGVMSHWQMRGSWAN
jgi:hypothetical protein